ncbi:MAG: hypothetical protein IPI74_03715 [Bacteroidales bacterium]|nr:hypothetical protein [Bacteroidales bacterium]
MLFRKYRCTGAVMATTPSTGTPGPVSIPVNYGINMTGTVYMIVFNYDYAGTLTSTAVRN